MRRLVRTALLLLLPCLAPAGACALDFAYGGGGSLNFSPVTLNGTYSGTASQVTSPVSATSLQFFDATYVVVQLGYFLNRGSTEPGTATGFTAVLTGLSFGLSLKLPIRLGPVEVFPIAGAEYVLNLAYAVTYTDNGEQKAEALSVPARSLDELWLKGGVGVDIFLGDLFLRPVVMGGFKPFGAATLTSTYSKGSLTLGLGSYTVDVYLLFGYRF